jgi:hypothetical protein
VGKRSIIGGVYMYIKSKLKRLWYKLVYGVRIGLEHSMLPALGKGKYVSVYRKGNYIDIVNESTHEFIRIIPYQPNHGLMVEKWENGRSKSRNILGYEQLNKNIIYASNVEQLCIKQS